jgi:hypothetical protein
MMNHTETIVKFYIKKKYRTSPTYESLIYEHQHLQTGGQRALIRTCEHLFMLRTWVSPRFECQTNDLRMEIWKATTRS